MEFQKNEIVTVAIEDISSDGFGVGKVDGFTVFVKDAVMGDVVEARIVKNKKSYAYGRLEKVCEPSPFRVKPKCACYRQCGGCQLQALDYGKQLAYKQQKIRNSLVRIGGFAPEYVDGRMEEMVGMENPFRYRNKAQYPVGTDRYGEIVTGFYAGRTHDIIANTDCLLEPAENGEVLDRILDYMDENRVSAYDEATGRGLVRHILIRKGFSSGEIMVCLVINKTIHKPVNQKLAKAGEAAEAEKAGEVAEVAEAAMQFLPNQRELVKRLAGIKGMTSVSVNVNTEKTNVIMGREVYTIWGEDRISDTIHVRDMGKPGYPLTGKGLDFYISPLSFYQVNPLQTEKLYSLALEYASLTGSETVWDLYCGIGTISLFLAGAAKKVYGVEVVPQAVMDAKENAARNGITNVEFFVGKAEEVRHMPLDPPDVIVVDPPRKGCDEACLSTMLEMMPERIVYVSCDPATLARDLKVLCGGGYGIERICGVDQFGMTVHVETVCLLSNRKPDTKVRIDVDLEDYYRIKDSKKNQN